MTTKLFLYSIGIMIIGGIIIFLGMTRFNSNLIILIGANIVVIGVCIGLFNDWKDNKSMVIE